MEEKKLTDEEIVKAILQQIEYGAGIPYINEWKQVKTIKFTEVLDFIQRLQSNNEELKKDYIELDLECRQLRTENDKQNAEIEWLTREYERIAYNQQEYLEWLDGFLRTHTVMKDRGEDYKMFDREWMCNTFWAKIEGSLDYIIDLENQRNELQKQVDEMKELSDRYFTKAYFYYQKCKAYGIESFDDDELEPKPAKAGKTITFPKFEHIEVE